MEKYDLTHARHDPAHCLAPGLFRSLKRGDRKRLKLHVVYEYGEGGECIEFSGPEPLGADDLRILQGLVAMAGPKGLILRPDPKTEVGQQLRLFLETRWESVEKDALVVKGSYRHLAREIGYADIEGGKVFRLLRSSIERLWKVSVVVQIDKRRMGFRLLSEYASDEKDGRLFVALNPRITEAILGRRPYTLIELNEVRKIKNGPTLILHQRLCGWINPGKSRRITKETLVLYILGPNPPLVSIRGESKRLKDAVSALHALTPIGWCIIEYACGKFEVKRPGLPPGLTVPKPRTNYSISPD